jgi:DNA (cytosine-5)-methyltransferase 1
VNPDPGASPPEPSKIPNHKSARLSALDMQIARSVPPGGNWKNVPTNLPSQRLDQIRESFARGEGSRSTYYGRLRPDRPAYTINTWFSRPGNGCHLHYDYEGGQHRVISQREAARLQSFPDQFMFRGSIAAVNKQIGNAVPPLLSYQIAKTLPTRGRFVDLFAGAGGLGLGFLWAGWEPVIANDIESVFLETYRENVHAAAVPGDIRDPDVFEELVMAVKRVPRDEPLWVIGGPPCQGFSTAGNRRSMDDERNHLVWRYKDFLDAVGPDGFLFENVTGILNMNGGRVFHAVSQVLATVLGSLGSWVLSAENYGIPQRRTRVFLVSAQTIELRAPHALTAMEGGAALFDELSSAVSVEEALSDLPALQQGQDGSNLDYRYEPKTEYQRLMRGQISPGKYVASLTPSSVG